MDTGVIFHLRYPCPLFVMLMWLVGIELTASSSGNGCVPLLMGGISADHDALPMTAEACEVGPNGCPSMTVKYL